MDLNKFAKRITLLEGKKKSLSIGQVKEVMKLVFTDLAQLDHTELEKILRRYR